MFDCIVIGGGPSGLMAAIAAAEQNKKVLLIEKGSKLGKKLAISGGGRLSHWYHTQPPTPTSRMRCTTM